jgi:hypothetical protein
MATLYEKLNEDRASRVESVQRVPSLELQGDSTELLPSGTGVLILSPAQSEIFDELRQAVHGNDPSRIEEIVQREKEERAQFSEMEIGEALDLYLSAPVYGDLRYGGKTIVPNAITRDEMGFTRVFFPFAGGEFDPDAFTFVEYLREPDAAPLKAMVVIHQPQLSDRERQVLEQLPEFSQEMKFGHAGDEVMATPAALVATVTAGLIVAGVGTALGHCGDLFHDRFDEVINPDHLNVNPALAVRDLVQIRRQQIMQM